jgi:xanthine dehydrogenase YagT iron-sulfur-binding subunit
MMPTADAVESGADAQTADAVEVRLKVNGDEFTLRLDPRVTLLDALRERLGLTGSKKGCDHGQCGACTALVNGRRINSCLSLAVMHDGEEITTIEGLARGEVLHPVQAALRTTDFNAAIARQGRSARGRAPQRRPRRERR